ncbi:hypothetical protein PR202_ga09018 [Eleusine coracana subsp. coracana]|uniref:RING-type domain-containing protein n=1 Tax=Eleusine coracana subsp. coracana TaxID=191504 RepID=A0AAV5C3P7_ELECO|nr:hypothetical protein PR202_ga09018 [Eleusine coracana subsp. coracana]
MASKSLCDACGHNMGLWQAAFTSECVHTFHLRCVSGRGACPECKAQWSDTPTVAPAPAPATPFSFASTPAFSASMFGQPATTSSFGFSSSPDFQTSLSGSSPQTTPSFSSSSGSPPAFGSSFSATSSPSLFGSSTSSMSGSSPQPTSGSSPFTSPSPPSFGIGTSLFGPQPAATPNPFASSPQFNSSPAFGSSSSSATSSPSLFGSWSPSLIGSLPQPTSGSSPFTTPSSTPAFGSRSLFGMPATANPFWLATDQSWSCSVCHGAMGRGQATITSECNHTFHLRCFSGSVCPVCGARWRDQVTVSRPSSSQVNPFSNPPPLFPQVNVTPRTPSPTPPTPSPFPAPSSPFSFSFAPANNPSPTPPPSSSLFNFNDDEPVEPPLEGWDTVPEVANNGALILTTHCEYPAVARDAAQENFAVLLHAKAPVAPAEASERAPLDLVTVLDVSYSMIGAKIAGWSSRPWAS